MNAFRDALRPQTVIWRRILVGLAAVAAIVAGLLAMHSLNIQSHHNEVLVAAHSETVAAEHHQSDLAGPVSGTASIGSCDGVCGMDVMAGGCILALLVAGLLFAAAATVTRSATIGHVLVRSVTAAALRFPAPPPSLHVLSISRT
jgi:hypothetical protein